MIEGIHRVLADCRWLSCQSNEPIKSCKLLLKDPNISSSGILCMVLNNEDTWAKPQTGDEKGLVKWLGLCDF